MNSRKMFVLLLFFCLCCALPAQDAKQLVQQAVKAELAGDANDHSCWIYHEVDRKPDSSVVQWVAETGKGSINRVVRKNGRQVPISEQRKQVEAFIHDPAAQAKQREDGRHDDEQSASMLKMLPTAFIWKQTSRNRWTTTFYFKPNPHFQPPNREARVFAAMEGEMTVNNEQHRIQELNGRLIHDVDFGFGLLGKLEAGGTFRVVRRQVGRGLWDITESHIHIHGHALIFKSISEEEDDVKTSWQRQPENVTLAQAAAAVMKK
ncbi:MAG TPA: hypothetical protein VFW25_00345 [Silvibacterium sp.]|nr:hypothetical protein [Silvibacterium sp.]